MEKYSYCKELREKYHIDELDSLTLTSRIDGFLDACNLNLENSVCTKEISPAYIPYINKNNDEEGYNINFVRGYSEYGKYFTVVGKYQDLNLLFMIYYDKDKKKNKRNILPYRVALSKEVNDCTYMLNIETDNRLNPRFDVTINRKDDNLPTKVTFNSDFRDFEDFIIVLDTIKLFVISPEDVFDYYREKVEKKSNKIIKKIFKNIK